MGRLLYFTTLILVSCQFIPLNPQNVGFITSVLCKGVHPFLISRFGETTVDRYLKFLQSNVNRLSEAVASALNVVIEYTKEILEPEGTDAKLPLEKVTPEGVVYGMQWALVAHLVYWILSYILSVGVFGVLKLALWLALLPLKFCFPISMFLPRLKLPRLKLPSLKNLKKLPWRRK